MTRPDDATNDDAPNDNAPNNDEPKSDRPDDATKAARETMADVDHTHPHTGKAFGETGVYDRGGRSKASDD